jgi:cell division protein FtsI/penicillin-binding protein 2
MKGRCYFIFTSIILWGLALLGVLFFYSVVKHQEYVKAAEEQHIAKKIIKGKRGQIYVYDSPEKESLFAVAINSESFRVSLVPKNVRDIDKVAEELSKIIGLSKEEIKTRYTPYKDNFYMPPLKKGLSYEQAEAIEKLKLVGVLIEREDKRLYPEKSLLAQTIGFVDYEGNGQYGIEGVFDSYLKPSIGIAIGRKDLLGNFVNILNSEKAKNGADIYLTIDRNVQFVVEEKLKKAIETYKADAGEVIVLEAKTGNILAMAQWPTFDLNEFNKVPVENHDLFLNKVIQATWEPGSILKPIVMAAALDSGAVPDNYENTYGNVVVVQGHEIHTATNKAYGRETLSQILENSDNVAMVDISSKLGTEKMYEYLKNFNFGEKLGIEIGPEASGKLLEKKKWRDINRATISFGQGISVTPLQIASAYLAIANGGRLIQPKVVEKIVFSDGREEVFPTKEIRRVISEETAKKITNMLISVVERGHGKKAAVPGYQVAGKTGTAQIPLPSGGYEENTHIGSFAGFLPADNPRFVILVKLDRPKTVEFAESSAAPTFSEIASFLLTYYKVPATK